MVKKKSSPVIFTTISVIYRTNPVIFRTNPIILKTNALILRTSWDRSLDWNQQKQTDSDKNRQKRTEIERNGQINQKSLINKNSYLKPFLTYEKNHLFSQIIKVVRLCFVHTPIYFQIIEQIIVERLTTHTEAQACKAYQFKFTIPNFLMRLFTYLFDRCN